MYFSYWNTKDMICTMTFSASASLSTSPMPRARSSASTAGSLTLALPHDQPQEVHIAIRCEALTAIPETRFCACV